MWACDPAMTATVLDSYRVVGPLFVQSMQTFLAAQCALAGEHLWPPDATEAVVADPNYDFIVVGSGSAGAVVANRLSAVPEWKVLLVEAGGDPTLANEAPQLFYNNMGTSGDWQYKSEPQEGSCRGYINNQCAWPRGKTLGGCSSINAMFYVRGNKLDYDGWAANGNEGWSYEDILPYFKKSEHFSGELTEESKKYHGKGGYLNVDSEPEIHDLEKVLIQAANELGLKILDDYNGDSQMGVAMSYTTTKDGIRQSTARAFLSPIRDRRNLHVIKNALVSKILFKPESNVVDGVQILKDGKHILVKADKEVIVSAGSINTPQLLLLSGIGPSNHLHNMGIEVKADLPVGENLQDHLYVPFFYTIPGDKNMTSIEAITKEFVSFILSRKGAYSSISPHRIISFYNTTDASALSPDIQFHYLVFPPNIHNLIDIYKYHGCHDQVQSEFRKLNEDKIINVIYAVLLRPKSRGKITLKNINPNEHPLIYANYFDDPDDLRVTLKGVKDHILQLGGTNTFKKVGFKLEWLDLDECKYYDKNSDEFLECYVRTMTFSLYHPVGTAKMGPVTDKSAVVNSELKVKKIDNLRVIDASIMPEIVRGNTNAPTIMIGEKGADMIKQSWSYRLHSEL